MKSVSRSRARTLVTALSTWPTTASAAPACSSLRSQQREYSASSLPPQARRHGRSYKGKERSLPALDTYYRSNSTILSLRGVRHLTSSAAPTRLGMDSEADLGRHFYLNKVLEQWAAKPATRMTLRQLIFFGRTLGRDREKILKSANYVRQELPVRIAHRIRDLQALPFVVMTNTHLEDVYQKYWSAFETFRRFPHIKNMDDNERFVNLLRGLLDDHLTIIPSLTIGIVESSHHLQPQQLDKFMERMLRSRISRRVLAEQHIALSEALDDPFHFFNEPGRPGHEDESEDAVGDHVGIIYTRLSVASVVNKGVKLLTQMFADVQGVTADRIPRVVVDGDLKARFAYIPEHLEYIVFELLKNAIRATIRAHVGEDEAGTVRVTIVEGPPEEDLIIRISDSGGGLPDLIHQLATPTRPATAQPVASTGFASTPSPTANGEEPAYPIPFPDMGHIGGYPPRGSRARLLHPDDESIPVTLSDETMPHEFASRTEPVSFAEPWAEPPSSSRQTVRGGVGSAGGTGGSTPPNEFGTVGTSTSSTDTYSDPLIDALCSFSNVRKRLEIEARSPSLPLSPPSSPEPTTPAHLTHAGLGTRSRFDALKTIGKFKGTVHEQTKPHAMEGTGPAALHTVQVETGLGLPMAKVYCDFFGGSLSFRSLDGHSTDIYVRLPKLGTNKETIEEIVL
ncbi:Histidine kinase-like ATPase, ATP-binding domain protein [Kalmanozyma brasiliensis GHG001]|uniref:Histidine kinase-like ATPase, ATP-binding domain protein n=1 Tax=Kalmanozyma brasiliensis (strain GHG001) TaxID=1365824 RepID=UPI002867F1F0|nr:Histidine kinase-like ATPase, ATP-binding domain protein [Kalmanozyma brasiliensis GHG001]KAF6767128.1 Histidine kinase-like ATPase, ATP-binding domain protein [Kalmanozyma brasiliensis GHG001]